MTKTRTDRVVTDKDIAKYEGMIESFLYEKVIKNFNEANMAKNKGDVSLGNSGTTMNDLRQYLRCEIVIALKNFNPDKGAKESSYVWLCLDSRLGMLMKRLTKKSKGYTIWTSQIEQVVGDVEDDGL